MDLQVLRHTQQPVSIYPTRHGEQRAPAEPAFTGDRAAPGFCREASPCTGTADPRVASSCRVSAPCGPSAAGSMPSCAAASSAAAAASMNRIRSRSSGSAGFGYGMPRTTTHLRRGATKIILARSDRLWVAFKDAEANGKHDPGMQIHASFAP